MLQFLANGLCKGAVYGILGAGFGLIYLGGRVFHVAHGAVFALGGLLCYLFVVPMHLPIGVAAILAVAGAIVLGLVTEVAVYKPLRIRQAAPLVLLVSSLGAYLVIENLLAIFFGNDPKTLRAGMDQTLRLGTAIITLTQVAQLAAGVLVVVALVVILRATRVGRVVRSVAENPVLASVFGIDASRTRLLLMGVGSALAGLAGVLVAWDVGIDAHAGMAAMMIGAVATLIGGGGNLLAPVFGGFLLGLIQSLVIWKASTDWENAVTFGLLLLLLLLRPEGLFGKKGT